MQDLPQWADNDEAREILRSIVKSPPPIDSYEEYNPHNRGKVFLNRFKGDRVDRLVEIYSDAHQAMWDHYDGAGNQKPIIPNSFYEQPTVQSLILSALADAAK